MKLEEYIKVPCTTIEALKQSLNISDKELNEGLKKLSDLHLISVLDDGKIIEIESTLNALIYD